MSNDVICTLIKKGKAEKDEYGNVVFPEKRTTVFAEKKSVRQSEFCQAAAVGFKPEIMLEIYSFEYHGEELCELDGERFNIYRTFEKPKSDRLELYLTALAGDFNGLTQLG